MLNWVLAVCLASLRLGPAFAFAPPFTLVRLPVMIRAAMVIALAVTLLGMGGSGQLPAWHGSFVTAAASELALGLAMALMLQWAFALIGMAGRALDIQAGFGLAFLIDPTTKAQVPLIGALFSYVAAAVFFATDGPYDVLGVFAASFRALPLGGAMAPDAAQQVIAYLGLVSVLSLGVAGLASTVLFLIDLVVAMMSRTLPQMNVLVLGFQIKAMAALLLLPLTLGFSAGVIARILRLASEAMVRVI